MYRRGKCRDPRRGSLGRLHLQLKPIWLPVAESARSQRSCEANGKKRNHEQSDHSSMFPVTKPPASQIKEVYETFSIKVELILTYRISAPTQYELHYPSLLS